MAFPNDGRGWGGSLRGPYGSRGNKNSKVLGLSADENSAVMSYLPQLLTPPERMEVGGSESAEGPVSQENLVVEALPPELSLFTTSSGIDVCESSLTPITLEPSADHEESQWRLPTEQEASRTTSCPVCGHREPLTSTSFTGVGLHPEQWSICRRCYSFRRAAEVNVSSSTAQGWVVPAGLFIPSLRRGLQARRGMFVDCSPLGFMKSHCNELFDSSLTISELEHNYSIKTDSITCYSCLETTGNTDWVLETLLSHLDRDGILRVNWLLPPFSSRPLAGVGWLEEKGVDLHYLPSRSGAKALLRRLGLRVLHRSRTINVPISCSGRFLQTGKVENTLRNRLQLIRTVLDSAMNAGFGEELVLIRDNAKPPGDIRELPWRPI